MAASFVLSCVCVRVCVCVCMCSPSSELVFSGQKDTDVYCTLTLKNVSEKSVAYKVSGFVE